MARAVKVGPFPDQSREYTFDREAPDHHVRTIQIDAQEAIDAININVNPDEATIVFKQDEFLTGITVRTGPIEGSTVDVVRSLTLHTNRRAYPYGRNVGTRIDVPVEYGEIAGFFGRKGTHVEEIGIYIAPKN